MFQSGVTRTVAILLGLSAAAAKASEASSIRSCESFLDSIERNVYLDGLQHRIPWEVFPEHDWLPGLQRELRGARSNVRRLERIRTPRDQSEVEKLVWELNTYSSRLARYANLFQHMNSTAQSKSLDSLAEEFNAAVEAFSVEFGQNEKIAKTVSETLEQDKLFYTLTTAQRRFLTDIKANFVNNGVYLEPAKKKRLAEIMNRLTALSQQFKSNLTSYIKENPFHVEDLSLLDGVPSIILEAAKHQAKAAGKDGALLLLTPSQAADALEFIKDRKLRESLWRAFSRRAFDGPYSNKANALEQLKLRHELAQLLGHKNFAEYVLQDRMVPNPEKLEALLTELGNTARPHAVADLEALKAYARSRGLMDELQPWDLPYYAKQMLIEKFNFDSEEFRPYLEFENILKRGVFGTFEKLHGVRLVINSQDPRPHPDVIIVDVYGPHNSLRPRGRIYIDPFQRSGEKSEGAWESTFVKSGLRPDGTTQVPVVGITTNILKAKSGPTLLKLSDLTTLLHEFGHGFHDLLSKVALESQSGTSVAWDFVELPSKFMERYADYVLAEVAEHHESKARIPQEMLQRYRATRRFQAGSGLFAKIRMSLLDYRMHTHPNIDSVEDLYELEKLLTQDYQLLPEGAYRSLATSFKHLFAGGYAVGYYSYDYADIMVACLFELFEKQGIWDPVLSERLRRYILERGGEENPAILFRDFYGKDPELAPFLRSLGILQD